MKKLFKKLPAHLSSFTSHLSSRKGFIQHHLRRSGAGFTLIELLIVVAIISALAIAVFVALNPAQRLKDAKDARRTADADTVLTAIHASIVDTKGSLPSSLTTPMLETQLGTGTSAQCSPVATTGCAVAVSTACVNLMTGTNNLTKYLKSMPISPDFGATTYSAVNTGYSVTVSADNIVTIKACGTEGTVGISVSR